MSSLTLSTPLQTSLLKCAAYGISVISPHTSLDSVQGGINDWLAECFTNLAPAVVEPLGAHNTDEVGAGLGRLVKLSNPLDVNVIIPAIKAYLKLKYGKPITHWLITWFSLPFASTIWLCSKYPTGRQSR